MIGVYELIVEDRSGTVVQSKLPSSRIRGLIGEAIKRYSQREKIDIYNSFFKPRFKSRPILNKIPLPKPYFIAYPVKLFGNNLYFQLRVMGYMNEVIDHVFKALSNEESRLKLLDAYIRNDLVGVRRRLVRESPPRQDGLISYNHLLRWARGVVSSDSVSIKMLFLTPAKLTRDGLSITASELKASDVLRFAARRLFLLDYLFYSRGSDLPIRLTPSLVSELAAWADGCAHLQHNLNEIDLKIRNDVGFIYGSLDLLLSGDANTIQTVLFLLKFGTYFGIGKKTAYGMGHYELTIG